MTSSIRRRDLLRGAGACAAGAPFINRLGAAARPPNILVLMTDQQAAEALSFRQGRRYIHTPAMDSLAAGGMYFSRAYCANPLCVPSRTSMFTGRYPSETGIQTNVMSPLDPERFPLLGTVFKRAGYATPYVGKWHLPYPAKDPAVHGFDILPYGRRRDEGIRDVAAEYLRSKPREPFLMVASFVNPHNICEWARGQDLPEGAIGEPPPVDQCPPLRANIAPQKNEPDGITLMRRSYHNTRMFPVGNFDAKKWREYAWAYYRMTELVDGHIGAVLKALEDSGQAERTVVVFLSDHGDCQGAHGWNQKTVFYDEAARVPLIVSWRGVTRPGVSDRLVHTGVDLFPTLCDYAGIRPPEGLPGLSLKASASGAGGRDSREYIVASNHMVQGGPVGDRTPTMEGRMVRSRRYKYSIHSEGERRESLVDMEKDPGEMVNLAGEAAYRGVLERHRAMLAEFREKWRDPFAA